MLVKPMCDVLMEQDESTRISATKFKAVCRAGSVVFTASVVQRSNRDIINSNGCCSNVVRPLTPPQNRGLTLCCLNERRVRLNPAVQCNSDTSLPLMASKPLKGPICKESFMPFYKEIYSFLFRVSHCFLAAMTRHIRIILQRPSQRNNANCLHTSNGNSFRLLGRHSSLSCGEENSSLSHVSDSVPPTRQIKRDTSETGKCIIMSSFNQI